MIFKKWQRGFTMLEAVVSVLLVMLFVLSVVEFFSIQNRNINSLETESATQDLADEAGEYFRSVWYANILPGTYVLARQIISGALGKGDTWTYELTPSTTGESSFEFWKYLTADSLALQLDDLTRMKNWFFKRVINVKELIDPFQIQKIRLVTVNIWSDGCDFSNIDAPCFSKQFIVSNSEKYE